MSSPFYGKHFNFTQPDRTQLEVKGWGDQHYAVFETLDGYTLIKDPATGYYQYADLVNSQLKPTGVIPNQAGPLSVNVNRGLRESREAVKAKVYTGEGLAPGNPRWKARREEAKVSVITSILSPAFMAFPPKRDVVGNYNGLCLLIEFPDVPGTFSPQEVEAFCNLNGYRGFNNNGSVFDYFFENSSGKLRYRNLVAPYYTAKKNREYYTDETIQWPLRAIELIEEALDFHKSNGFNFTELTSDTIDYVYALNIFYAGDVINNWSKGLWPHSHNLNTPYQLVNGKFAYDYQITNIGDELTLGTFCHENGHMICDFPDLYDYGDESRGVGLYCLMGTGGGIDKKNLVQIGAYLKFRAGWTDTLTSLTDGLKATISFKKNDFYILRKNSAEYYLLENRSKAGRDAALTDEGLAIWHIDEFGNNSSEQMTSISHYECSLIQADNKNHLELNVNEGDNNDLFKATGRNRFGPFTQPQFKWWDATKAGLEIYNIGPSGEVMSFFVK